MAVRYQFVERFDPADRTASIEYAPGRSIDFMGDPVALTDAQAKRVSEFGVLNRLEDGEEPQAEFGPAPEPKEEEKKDDPDPVTPAVGSSGNAASRGTRGGGS